MKHFHPLALVAAILSITVAACGSLPAAPVAPTQEPAAAVESQGQPGQPVEPIVPTPSLQPINLGGPPAGTPMVWVDGSILVHVPGGNFIMGDGGADNPIHTVGLSSFWIYRTKVTNRMYSICVAVGECTLPLDEGAVKALSDPAKRDLPVVNVDWQQAETYCSFVEGHLPTEAQWEKTARGPEGSIYPWGDAAPTCDLLNFKDCVGEKSDVYDHPVGKSYYDALDLSGNVFEWVADWYTPGYYSESPGVDPLGPEISEVRSVRSTSFNSEGGIVSSARRFYLKPNENRLDLGFRCVVENPEQYEPFCQPVAIPGYPGSQTTQPSSNDCPKPTFKTFIGNCIDQAAQIANGSVEIGGGDVVSVVGHDCYESSPGLWFCTGPQGSGVSLTACLACEGGNSVSPTGTNCPPGTYEDGKGGCIGKGSTGLCPKGYAYDANNLCCQAGTDIPYPGCNPTTEFMTLAHTCQQGSAPLGDSCGVVSVPMGSCKQPGTGGQPDPCTGLDIRSCYNQKATCHWDTSAEQCVSN